MKVSTVMFVDAANNKTLDKEYAFSGEDKPLHLLRGDVVSFAGKGDDLVRWTVQARELQEVGEGTFALLYTLRQVPKEK